jgi:hypothetical protein
MVSGLLTINGVPVSQCQNVPSDGRDQGRIWSSSASHQPTIGGQIMKRLTSAQLFAPPKIARKTKARLERAKLVVVAARERAAETAQRYSAQPSTKRPPTVLQRRGLAERFSAKF